MALIVDNLAHVAKFDPKLGEGLRRVQTYVNQNTTPQAGNKQQPPPATLTNLRTTW